MEWSRGQIIGHGSSATVSLATQRGGIFAVKSTELAKSEALQREQTILSSLCSPYVVTYKGCDITMEMDNKLYYNLFMEYMPFGTLVQEIRRHGGRLSQQAIAGYTRQISQGLEYLHSKGLVHCDIKGANILIGKDGAKIGDFGCAKSVDDAESATVIGGTPMFMAPEVARGEEQGCASDVWSLGCTLIEMANGAAAPWPNVSDPFSVLYHIAYSGEVPEIPCYLSDEAKDFLEKCLRRNPQERWTASQLLNHPFLGGFSSKSKQVMKESNSTSSPTSILEQGYWSSLEEAESGSLGNLVHTSSEEDSSHAAARVKKLALCSGEPCWAWHGSDDDGVENWIIIRGNESGVDVGAFGHCGSETASTSDELALQELVKSNVVVVGSLSGHFCQDNNKYCRDNTSVLVRNVNFDTGIIAEMPLPVTLDIL